ncbi:MAG: aspartate aminotransferase family protein [Gammaproteobacteria bacterium]|nr:aspartate aminotransferase family protein [Gammaproteobacteria bacterium]
MKKTQDQAEVLTGDSGQRALLEKTLEHALTFLASLDSRSVAATASRDELLKRLDLPLAEKGESPGKIIDELVAGADAGLNASTGGRFFAWVIGGNLPAALAADWLNTAWDQNGALHATSPALGVIEEICGRWLKQLLDIPDHASFALVTGCQMSHATCLAAARNKVLADHGWDVESAGMAGAPQLQVLGSRSCHGSVERAIRLLGIGRDNLVALDADADGRLSAEALEQGLANTAGAPAIVVLQAGEINTGIYDPFEALIEIAHRHNAWVHVDGAFGLWAAASERYRHLMRGCEKADSWSTDGHKWLNVPFDCGYAFVAHPEHHRRAMSHRASYLVHDEKARDPMDYNPEWSRRGRAVSTYAALRELGRSGVARIVDNCCMHAHTLVTGIGKLDGAELLREPVINQGLVRFPDPRPDATEEDHAHRTDRVIALINATGEAFFSGSTWQGKRCMRISVCSWQTSEIDVRRSIAATRSAIATAG